MSKKVFRDELKTCALFFIYLFMGIGNPKKEKGRGAQCPKNPPPLTSLLINENHSGSISCIPMEELYSLRNWLNIKKGKKRNKK